ncbi:tyrocidine synthetase 1, partial [Aspergillus ellipticus CBS 707.79]
EHELLDLTPVQLELLTSIDPHSAWTSFTFDVPEHMAFSIDRLRMTWQAMAAHHPILRTVIVPLPNGDDLARQSVVHHILPMGFGTWEPLNKTVPYLVYQERDQASPSLTLHYHRALIDDKSLLLIRNDFELFFHGYAFPTRIPFTTYARSISMLNHSDTSAFWRSYLENYSSKQLFRVSGARDSSMETVVSGDEDLLSRVEDFAQDHQVNIKTVVLAAWFATSSRHLDSSDLALYTDLRDHGADAEEYIVGPMDVMAPLRMNLVKDETVLGFIYRLDNEEKTASGHTYIGAKAINQLLGSNRPNIIFNFFDSELPTHSPQARHTTLGVSFTFVSAQMTMTHDPVIPSARVQIVLQHFWEALERITESPYVLFESLSLVSKTEESALMGFRSSRVGVVPRLVHNLIQEQAASHGDDIAIRFERAEAMTFSQLNSAANGLARQMVGMMSPGSIIPVHMDVSINFIIALLAILKAGGGYVILDPEQPMARKIYIVKDVNAPFYITQQGAMDKIPHTNAVLIEDLFQGSVYSSNLNLPLDTENPAYVIYTSGSTGAPKGVVLSHRAASAGILCAPGIPNNHTLLYYNPVFSAAQRTILSTLSSGGCLCLASRSTLQLSLATLINEMQVTNLGITSSTITLLEPTQVPTLQSVTLTGEALDHSVAEKWAERVELRNNYGLSECTQLNWGRIMTVSGSSSRNVGLPTDTTSAFILDPGTLQLSPFLVPGELCLQGPQLASGYLNKPDLTNAAFLASPFEKGQRLYRTGDMAIRMEDGTIEIIGRVDFQTKINGQRVEPGEISALLRMQESVRTAVVVAAKVEGENALIACIVPHDTALRLKYRENADEDGTLLPYSLIPDTMAVDKDTYEDIYPVTALQEGIISAHQTKGGYIYHRTYRVRGINIARLQESFQSIIDNNAIYRTGFIENGPTFLQAVHRQFQLRVTRVHDMSVDEYVGKPEVQNVDISKPPIQAAILDDDVLVVTIHHALFDFWSSRFLFEDTAAVYLGQPVLSRPSFNIFVQHLQSFNDAAAAEFWSDYLQGASQTRLATEEQFNSVKSALRRDLRAFTASTGVTIGALIYATWALLLWKHTGNTDVTFAVTLSGRDAPIRQIQDLNGPTLTTVPVRVQIQSTDTLAQLLLSVQDELWKVSQYSQLGLRRILQASAKSSDLFDSMVNFLVKRETSQEHTVFQHFADRPIWETGFTSLEVEEGVDGEFEIRLSGYLEPIRTGFVLEQVVRIFDTMLSDSRTTLREVDVIAESEAKYLGALCPPVITNASFLHDQFERVAIEAGNRTAIEFENSDPVSYPELNNQANQFSRYLVRILKAGGAFVPLDPDNPPERNNFIVKDVQAKIVLTDENLRGIFDGESNEEVEVVDVYNIDVSDYAITNFRPHDLEPNNLAYAIYTSGSTGLPKGVLISHRSIAAGIESIIHAEQWQPEWRVLQFSNYVFDVSVGDIFCTLGTGATLCMAPMESLLSDLASVINAMAVDRLFLTPTVAKLIQPEDVPAVQGIYLAGEPVTPDLVETWTPHCVVMNCYGPTEASILAAVGTIEQGGNARVIGYPLKNCINMILEPDSLRMAPYGALGELCLSGPQIARGYLNRPEATNKAFVTKGKERVYRTGDLARWIPGKLVECFGRKDSQVKINGHRIELGEIESAILKAANVHHAIVAVVEIQKKAQLIAFCVVDPANSLGILPAEEYLETLTSVSISLTSLPPYMVPSIWIPMGTLPLLPSGKTNRKKLVEWIHSMESHHLQGYSNAGAHAEFMEPVTPEEKLLQVLWAALFHKEPTDISAASPFFAHGGDSISAINLVSKCKGQGYILAVGDVLAFPLLQDMASRMRPVKAAQTAVEKFSMVVPANVYATLADLGVSEADIETVYPAPPGVEDFLVRGAKPEQFWQCQTVRSLPDILDFDQWIRITTELTARNEILRSMWLEVDRSCLQVVLAKPVLDLQVIQCSSEADKQRQIDQTWDTKFTLGKPFIFYRLLVLPDGSRDLLIKIHHAMYDGTLLRIFDDEFKALFKGQTVPTTVPFGDYVSHMHSTDKKKSLQFWEDLLRSSAPPFPVADNPIASALAVTGTDRKVDSFAANCGVTVSIVFQTAFSLLLCRLSGGRTDVTYDNLITGRNVDLEEAQTIAGTCANFLPFRTIFHEETSIRELLKTTQSLFWKTTENGDVSLNDIYRALGQDRVQSASRALFLFQPFDQPTPTTNILEKHMRWMVMALSTVRMPVDYALHLEVSKTPVGYQLKWKYDPRVYPVDEFEGITEAFSQILESVMSHSRSRVSSLI